MLIENPVSQNNLKVLRNLSDVSNKISKISVIFIIFPGFGSFFRTRFSTTPTPTVGKDRLG